MPASHPPRDTGDLLAEAEAAGYHDLQPSEVAGHNDLSWVKPARHARPVRKEPQPPGRD